MLRDRNPFEALQHFWVMAQRDHGGARVAAKLLLGLYNGDRFPFDLTELRCLDDSNFEMAIDLLRLDSRPQQEVHQHLNQLYGVTDMGMRFEHLAHAWRMKGRCRRDCLNPVPHMVFE